MLPLLNLTISESIGRDALKGASSLVPEASDALDGGFAAVLGSTVHPAVLLSASAGEDLPMTGNPLPVSLSGAELELDTGIEISVEEADFVPPIPDESVDTKSPGVAVPVLSLQAPEPASDAVQPDDGLPVTIHVPPAPDTADDVNPDIPAAAADTAGDGVAAVLQVPALAPVSNAGERGMRVDDRERVTSTPTSRPGVAASVTVPLATAGADAGNLTAGGRSDTAIDDRGPQLLERRGSSTDVPAPTMPSMASRDTAPRGVRDDALSITKPLQPATWQAGTVAPDFGTEHPQRMHADFPVAAPRAATPAQPLPPTPPASQAIDIPVQQSGWDNALADRVTLMANGRLQNAELRLTPAELGPLRIQLEIDDGVANVSFQSQHPVTREALEQAMPRLRELLQENGLSLGQADVRDNDSQNRSRETLADGRGRSADGTSHEEFDNAATVLPRRGAHSLVDTFA